MDERPDIPRIVSGHGVPHTAAEAMAHAEAKAGIRDATNLRHTGVAVALGGVALALRQTSHDHLLHAAFMRITFIPGHVYELSLGTTLFLLAAPVGVALAIVGQILRTRRIESAKSNPATVGIFDPASKWQ